MSASIETAGSGLLALQIHVSPDLQLEAKFEPSRQEAVQELLSTLAAT
jgi:hypothetical protein